MTRERPILFRPELVRAILDGRKTVTRRPVTPQPCERVRYFTQTESMDSRSWLPCGNSPHEPARQVGNAVWCPYGAPGDRLWVRETAWYDRASVQGRCFFDGGHVRMADGSHGAAPWPVSAVELDLNGTLRKRPGIHMPRWACRLVLRVEDVRPERLQEITEADARAEGAPKISTAEEAGEDGWPSRPASHLQGFVDGWDRLYRAPPELHWSANPWVWRVAFSIAEARL